MELLLKYIETRNNIIMCKYEAANTSERFHSRNRSKAIEFQPIEQICFLMYLWNYYGHGDQNIVNYTLAAGNYIPNAIDRTTIHHFGHSLDRAKFSISPVFAIAIYDCATMHLSLNFLLRTSSRYPPSNVSRTES